MERPEVMQIIEEKLRELNLNNHHDIFCREHNPLDGTHKESEVISPSSFNAPWVDVRDYGEGVGTGGDDTVALTNAINATPTYGTLFIPNGYYKTTSTLSRSTPINIIGEDSSRTQILGTGIAVDTPVIDLAGTSAAPIRHMRMENIMVRSDDGVPDGIEMNYVQKSVFRNIRFFTLRYGFKGSYNIVNKFENITSDALSQAVVYMVDVWNANHFDQACFLNAHYGVRIKGSVEALKFTNCVFEKLELTTNSCGVYADLLTGKTIHGIVFDNCYFERVKGKAIHFEPVDADSVAGFVCKGSTFNLGHDVIYAGDVASAQYAIVAKKVTGFDISDNFGLDIGESFIYRDGTESNGRVEDNILTSCPKLSNTALNVFSPTVAVRNNTYGRKEAMGTAAPVAGTWAKGDTYLNTAPSAGGVPGWVCTTAGTPGTWKAMPNLAA